MKVSRKWLQKYFEKELPSADALAEALTFHAFEIETYDEDMLDVKVLPDRAGYALSHRGIAYELSAILGIPLSYDPFREPLPQWQTTDRLQISADPAFVIRHLGALVRGVRVGPSPAWLKNSLEAVGQRSINNVVDVLNYVMLATGQPSGAFDLDTIAHAGGVTAIEIRRAKEGERISVLTGEAYVLTSDMFVFADATNGTLLDIAGIKGGLSSGVNEKTTNLFISVGTYDPTLLRRTAQSLKLFTDASTRYQNQLSPECGGYGMKELLRLLQEVAGGEVEGVIDEYPRKQESISVTVSLESIRDHLGFAFTRDEIESVFARLMSAYEKQGDTYVCTPPFYRRDIRIPEDITEEVGRIMGYDRLPSTLLFTSEIHANQARWRGIERVKDMLVDRGYTEISTPSFSDAGEVLLANPLQSEKPYLRSTLRSTMRDALVRAAQHAPRVLGPATAVRLFEIGTIFTKEGERLSLSFGYKALSGKEDESLEETASEVAALLSLSTSAEDDIAEFPLGEADLEKLGEVYEPRKVAISKFHPFPSYPFALRDIAVWTPQGTEETEVANAISGAAGELLARLDLFDRFEKDGHISYAFRLVFESFEKTLSDVDLNPRMERITDALNSKEGWEVR
ncbi:MAG: phenylalanine--tRNA ligase subunit beta [Minisyncoccia bacterium]